MFQDPSLIHDFVDQAFEHLESVEPLLLELEKTGRAETEPLNAIFRAVHNIKGAAGLLSLDKVQDLSHALEALLMQLRDRRTAYRAEMAEPLLRGFDELRRLVSDLPGDRGAPAIEAIRSLQALSFESARPGAVELAALCESQTRRGHGLAVLPLSRDEGERRSFLQRLSRYAEVVCLDYPRPGRLLAGSPLEHDLLAEALQLPLEQLEAYAGGGVAEANRETLPDEPPPAAPAQGPPRHETVRVSVALLDRLMNLTGELVLGRNQLRQLLDRSGSETARKAVFQTIDRVTAELQESIMTTRMQPIRVVFERLPRLVRDMGQRVDKRVELDLRGADVELDRSILEALADPLTHLLRNAVDHGLEDELGRRALCKPEVGRIQVQAFHERGRVVVEVKDDGRGVNPERVKEAAVRAGLLSRAQTTEMSHDEALALIFQPGVSTADSVSRLSGRGVGMDVVRHNIESLGGRIEVDTSIGRGTAFRIQLPLTLAILPNLVVSLAGVRFAIPQASVLEAVHLRGSANVARVRDREVLRLRGGLLPLVRLADLLGIDEDEKGAAERGAVVLRCGASRFALVLDELCDSEEIVVKPLSSYFSQCALYAGAAILGDGSVALVLDPIGMARAAGIRFDDLGQEPTQAVELDPSPSGLRSLVVFAISADEHFALPLDALLRLESASAQQIERVGGREYLRHHGRALPLIRLEQVLPVSGDDLDADEFFVLIPRARGREAGIVARRIVDTLVSDARPDPTRFNAPGVLGSAIIEDHLTLFLDAESLLSAAGIEAAP